MVKLREAAMSMFFNKPVQHVSFFQVLLFGKKLIDLVSATPFCILIFFLCILQIMQNKIKTFDGFTKHNFAVTNFCEYQLCNLIFIYAERSRRDNDNNRKLTDFLKLQLL